MSRPSTEDIKLTDICMRAGQMLDIAVLDHLIIGAGEWLSVRTWLKQQGD